MGSIFSVHHCSYLIFDLVINYINHIMLQHFTHESDIYFLSYVVYRINILDHFIEY